MIEVSSHQSRTAGAAIVLALAAAAPSAQGAEVEEVVVTGRSIEDTLPQELSRYGHDVHVVTDKRIREAGYVDVSSALQNETPGLFVSPGSGPFDYVDVSLQGSRTGDVLWLIDGVRINNRIFNDTSPDTLPAAMVERVEVLKGGESLFYGTQGVAGAVNMVTRSFSETPDAQIGFGYDTNDSYRLDGHARTTLGAHKLVLYGSKADGEGYEQYDAFQPSATDRKRSYDVENFGLKYGFDFTENLRLDLLYHHTDATLDNNSAVRTKRSYNERDEDVVSARLDYTFSRQLQFFFKAYLHDWDTTYANIQNHPLTGAEVVVFAPGTYWGYRDYGLNGMAKLAPGGRLEYFAGYDYQNYRGRDDVFPIDGKTETVHAVFAQIRTAADHFEDLSLAAGARYNRGSGGKDATVWNVSGRYEVSPSLYLQGMVATAFLLPSAEQLYYLGEFFDDYAGNPDLLPEESRNLNLSIGGHIPLASQALTWQLTGFARDIDNLIEVTDENPLYPNGRYENVDGEVNVRGGELALEAALGSAFRLSTSYTYTRSRDAGSDLQRQRTPRSFAKATLSYAPPQRAFGASASLNWVGDVYQAVTGFGRRNFGDYTVVDLVGHWYLDRDRRHRLGMRLQNALDEEYATRLARAQLDDGSGWFLTRRLGVPRTFHVTYTYDF